MDKENALGKGFYQKSIIMIDEMFILEKRYIR